MSDTPVALAVLLCTRDRPEMLQRALAQLEAVHEEGVEVVVVDSASRSVSTQEVVAATPFRYVRSEVPGLTIARNVALRATTADVVVFIDDDCLPQPGWLDPLREQLADPSVGAVSGLMAEDDDAASAGSFTAARLTRVRQGLDGGHGAVMAMRRDLVLGFGGFDEVLGAGRALAGADDLDIFCRVLAAGSAVVREPRSIVRHAHTREDTDHRKLYLGYGLGLGAMVAKWWRVSPRDGAQLTAVLTKRWLESWVRALRGGLRTRRARADRALAVGMVRGFAVGLRTPLSGSAFVDVHPPAPVFRPTSLPDQPPAQVPTDRPTDRPTDPEVP